MPSGNDPSPAAPVRAAWARAGVQCLEARAQITAYAGARDQRIDNR